VGHPIFTFAENELHLIVGAGSSEDAMYPSNTLKQAFPPGQI
jgi:ATP-dependent Clp protease ATP-binding subunit ClpA